MRSCYCTCFCGSTIHQFIGNWKEFLRKPDSYALIDTHGESISDLGIDHQFLYSESDVRKNLNFNHSVSKKHFWNSQGNKNIIWFYAHLRMMNFFLKNPTYDYYWFFDDDVKCNDWDSVLDNIDPRIDFLSYFTFKRSNVTSQHLVPPIDNKTYSGDGWFNRFPGDTDTLPAGTGEYFGSFFPIVRFSNSAMKTLVQLNLDGFFGYSEGFVPTTLNYSGHTLDTLYLPDNTSKHFDANVTKITHKNQTINWEWI